MSKNTHRVSQPNLSILDAESLQKLARVVRRVEETQPRAMMTTPPSNPHRVPQDAITIKNETAGFLPRGAVVCLDSFSPDRRYAVATPVPYPGILNVGITTWDIPEGGTGFAWVDGIHWARCYHYTYRVQGVPDTNRLVYQPKPGIRLSPWPDHGSTGPEGNYGELLGPEVYVGCACSSGPFLMLDSWQKPMPTFGAWLGPNKYPLPRVWPDESTPWVLVQFLHSFGTSPIQVYVDGGSFWEFSYNGRTGYRGISNRIHFGRGFLHSTSAHLPPGFPNIIGVGLDGDAP